MGKKHGLKWATPALALLCLTQLGCGDAKYATPQAVVDEANKCVKARDYAGFCRCLTPEAQDQMAATMVQGSIMLKQLAVMLGGEKEVKPALAEIDKVLEKHGVAADKLDFSKLSDTSQSKDVDKTIKSMTAGIKDKPQFVGDMIKGIDSISKDKKEKSFADGKVPFGDAKLQDVKIDGNSATGTLVNGKEKSPVKFAKIDGGWRIALDVDALK